MESPRLNVSGNRGSVSGPNAAAVDRTAQQGERGVCVARAREAQPATRGGSNSARHELGAHVGRVQQEPSAILTGAAIVVPRRIQHIGCISVLRTILRNSNLRTIVCMPVGQGGTFTRRQPA